MNGRGEIMKDLVIDAHGHILEPADLWTNYIESKSVVSGDLREQIQLITVCHGIDLGFNVAE